MTTAGKAARASIMEEWGAAAGIPAVVEAGRAEEAAIPAVVAGDVAEVGDAIRRKRTWMVRRFYSAFPKRPGRACLKCRRRRRLRRSTQASEKSCGRSTTW